MTDSPEAFQSYMRKARKIHGCCECGVAIKPGDKYQYSSGIWDGEPSSYKQCMSCHVIMAAAQNQVDRNETYRYEDGPYFGALRDWFEGHVCRGFSGQVWLDGMADEIGIDPEQLNKLLKVEKETRNE
jgi:hypothetical protein